MPWTRLDDQFWANPKLQALSSDTARWLYVAALNWSVGNLTDGRITTGNARRLLNNPRGNRAATALHSLTKCGLFVPDMHEPDVWWINDFAEYQPTKTQVEQRRKADRERKAKQRRGDSGQYLSRRDSGGSPQGVTPSLPVPSRPDPDIPISPSLTHTLADTLNGPEDDDASAAQPKDEDPPPPTGADPTLWAQALERLHKQEAKGNTPAIAHRDLYVGAIYNHLIGEKQQHEANTRAAEAITNCTNCDDTGITWTTQDGTPTTRDNPNATTGHQCTHLHAVEDQAEA